MQEKALIEPKRIIDKKNNNFEKAGKIFAYLMILPGLVHFLVFWLYVNYSSVVMAFTYQNSLGEQVFSFFNFQKIVAELFRADSIIYVGLLNTMKYFVFGQIKGLLSCVVAYFFYKKMYLHKLYRIIFYLPAMIPQVVYIVLFKRMIMTYGPVFEVLYSIFGYELPVLLANSATATPTILFYTFYFGFGTQMFIYIGTMNRIPLEVIEASRLDGCTGASEFFRIIIPLIWETMATYLILSISKVFLASGPILYFTGDGSFDTYTLSFWIFNQARNGVEFNYASAIGIFFTVLALPLVFLSRKLLNKVETVSY